MSGLRIDLSVPCRTGYMPAFILSGAGGGEGGGKVVCVVYTQPRSGASEAAKAKDDPAGKRAGRPILSWGKSVPDTNVTCPL